MEGSNEVHGEEDKARPEMNKKRRLKTPSQVEALEKFYDEHKYPSEEMKLELAEKIGLTEKQVSGWFCHRRLKDKRISRDEAFGNGRLDRSSGVIQDHCSGLGQDSCGSTKPGDYKHVDLREVESRRLVGQDFLAVDQEDRGHHTGNLNGMDDTSSESSSALQGNFLPQSEDPFSMEASRYSRPNGASMPINEKAANDMGPLRRPSGYLKVKGKIEHAAITAVKRQLGRHYREDGPLLGVEFDPLPPGAFEEIFKDPTPEPYLVSGPTPPHAPDVSGCKQHVFCARYNSYSPKIYSQSSNLERDNFQGSHGPDSREIYSHLEFKQKSSISSQNKVFPGQDASKNIDEVYAGETSMYDGDRGQMIRSKHAVEGMRSRPGRGDLLPYGRKISSEQMEPYLNNCTDTYPKIVQHKEYLKTELSKLKHRPRESHDIQERKLFRRMPEDEKLYGGRDVIREYSHPTKAKAHTQHELVLAKRGQDEYVRPDYWKKASIGGKASRRNKIKGSAVEIPSSFSEDETAETSTSMD